MNKRQIILIVIVIAIGAVLGGLILTWDNVARPEATRGYNDKSDSSQATHNVTIMAIMTRLILPTARTRILKPKISQQGIKAKAASQAKDQRRKTFYPGRLRRRSYHF